MGETSFLGLNAPKQLFVGEAGNFPVSTIRFGGVSNQ
jgi:hypothetical protein